MKILIIYLNSNQVMQIYNNQSLI